MSNKESSKEFVAASSRSSFLARQAALSLLVVAVATGAACTETSDEAKDVDGDSAQALAGEVTLFTASDTPAIVADPDTSAVELGMRFRADVAGSINGIRFYKSSTNTGTHVGHLWSNAGTLLASATFTSETASGWQTVRFDKAVNIAAGTTYVASYHSPRGRYSATNGAFANKSIDRAPLHGLRDGQDGRNGVHRYGASGFPSQTWQSTNYFVDVLFQPSSTDAGTPPSTDGGTTDSGTTTPTDSGTTTPTDSGTTTPSTTFPKSASEVGPTNRSLLRPSGTIRVTQSGTVIENVDVNGSINIASSVSNVTIRNFRVYCGGAYFGIAADGGNSNIIVEDGEIDGGDSCHDGMRGSNCTARRLYVHNMGGDAFKADGNNVIERCFVTTIGQGEGAHGDGIQMMGNGNIRILRNNFLLTTGSLTACVFPGGGGFIPGVHVDGNRLEGGAYVVYCNSDMVAINNSFGREYAYGIKTDGCKTWSGNVWADNGMPAP